MTLWEHGTPLIQWGVVIGASLVAAGTDLTTRKIPNSLTGPVCLAGLVWATYAGGLAGLCDSLVACVMLAAPYVLLFLFAGGGAGDAKLMGAIGAWLGIINGVIVLLAVSASAILLAIGFALARKRLRRALASVAVILSWTGLFLLGRVRLKDRKEILIEAESRQTMPYGVAIFVGVCVAAGGVMLWYA